MATERNTPDHRWYKRENHVALAKEDYSREFFYQSGIEKIAAATGELVFGEGGASPLSMDFQTGRFFANGQRQSSIYDIAPDLERAGNATTVDANGNVVYVPQTLVWKTDFSSDWTPDANMSAVVTDGVARLTATGANARYEQLNVQVVDDASYGLGVQARLISGNGEVDLNLSGLGTNPVTLTSEWTDLSTEFTATSTGGFRWRVQITNSGDVIEIRFPSAHPTPMQDVPAALRTAGAPATYLENTTTSARYLARTEHHLFTPYSTDNEAPASALTEMVVNGGFDTDSDWTKGTGWTISGGVATHASGTSSAITQARPIAAGQTYRCTVTVSGRTTGSIYWRLGDTTNLGILSANGTATQYITATASGTYAGLFGDATFDGSIDDVSIELVGELGAELVTNGDLSDGLTGVTISQGTASVTDGVIELTNGTRTVCRATWPVTLTKGQTYLIRADAVVGGTLARDALIGVSLNSDLSSGLAVERGPYGSELVLFYTATTTGTHYVGVTTDSIVTGETGRFDNMRTAAIGPAGDWNKKRLALSSAVTNLHTDSEDATIVDVAVTTTRAVADDGWAEYTVAPTATNANHYVSLDSPTAMSFTSGTTYTLQAEIKARGDQRYAALFYGSGAFTSTERAVVFDLLTGVVEAEDPNVTGHIIDMGGGRYLCATTATATTTATSDQAQVILSNDGTRIPTYTGDTADGVIVKNLMVIEGSVPQLYCPTFGASASFVADTFTIPAAQMPWPEPVFISSELMTNGDFSDGSTGYTLTACVLDAANDQVDFSGVAANLRFDTAGSFTAGNLYRALVEVSNYSGGTLSFQDAFSTVKNLPTGDGTYEVVFVKSGVSDNLRLNTSDFTGSVDSISIKEIDPRQISFNMAGEMTYADDDSSQQVFFGRIDNGSERIQMLLATNGTRTGSGAIAANNGTAAFTLTSAGEDMTPGTDVNYSLAWRASDTEINVAKDGSAATPASLSPMPAVFPGTDLDIGTHTTDTWFVIEKFQANPSPAITDTDLETVTA